MLWKRILSAAIPLPLIILLIHFGPTWGWGLFIGFCAGVCFYEYLTIAVRDETKVSRAILVVLGVGAFWGFHSLSLTQVALILAGTGIFSFIWVLARPADLTHAFSRVAGIAFGFLYAPLLLSFLVRLHGLPNGREWVYISFLVAWSGDTIAYFTGRLLGKHKLYPRISPGKTIEGAVGGLMGSVLGVVIAKVSFFPDLTWRDCILVGIVGAILGQVGDLAESMLKRSFGVKDSGTIMPGHGGLLDRVDALMFILPFVFTYAVFRHLMV